MVTTVGSLILELGLDQSSYQRSMDEARRDAQKFMAQMQKAKAELHIKPTVDHKPLVEFNQHINVKESHIDRLNRKVIKPKIDFSDLDRMEAQLKRIQNTSVKVSASGNASGGNSANAANSNQQLADKIGQSVSRAMQPSIASRAASAVSNVAKVPLQIASGAIGNVASGLTFGITQEVTKNLGGGLSKAIESAIGGSIGSTELLGQKIGESASKAIAKKISDLLPGELQAQSKDKITKFLGGNKLIQTESLVQSNRVRVQERSKSRPIKDEIQAQIQDTTREKNAFSLQKQELENKVNTLEEQYAKLEKITSTTLPKTIDNAERGLIAAASPGSVQIAKDLYAKRSQAQSQLENLQKSDEPKQIREQIASLREQATVALSAGNEDGARQALAQVKKLEAKLSKYNNFVNVVLPDRITKIDAELQGSFRLGKADVGIDLLKDLSEAELQMKEAIQSFEAIPEAQENVAKELAQVERDLERSTQQRKELLKKREELAPTTPQAYDDLLKQIDPNIQEYQKPQLVVADAKLKAQGFRAQHLQESNTIEITQELMNAIEDNALDREQRKDLGEELAHARDFDYGSYEGVNARKRNQIIGTPLQPTEMEMAEIAPELEFYEAEARKYEMNAKVAAIRAANTTFEKGIAQPVKVKQFAEEFGYGGQNLEKKGLDQISAIKADILALNNAANQYGVDISEGIAQTQSRLDARLNELLALSSRAKMVEALPSSEIDDLYNEINAEIDNLASFAEEFASYKQRLIKEIGAARNSIKTSQQPLNVPVAIKEPELVEIEIPPQTLQIATQANLPATPKASEFTALATPTQMIEEEAANIEAEVIERAKEVSGIFRSSYADLKAALKSGDTKIAIALSKTIQDNADAALEEIAQLTAELGDAASFGTTIGNQLANTKAQISRTANSSQQELIKARNRGQINPDELSAMRRDVQSQIDAEMQRRNGTSVAGDDELSAARLDLEKVNGKGISNEELKQLQELNSLLIELEKNADRFDAAFGKLDPKTAKTLEESHQALRKTADELGELAPKTEEAEGGVSSLAAKLFDLGKGALSILTLATITPILVGLGNAALNVATEFERFETRLAFSVGGMDEATDRISELREESNRLGTDLKTTIATYSQFAASTKGTNLEGVATEQVFSGVSQAASVQQLDPQRQELVFGALSQMASKSVISMEELRQQLGECYDADTAVLSSDGWILWRDITRSHKLATLNLKTNKVSYVIPNRHIKKWFKGHMIRVRTQSIDLLVTPNHRMIVKELGSSKVKAVFASELQQKPYIYLTSIDATEESIVHPEDVSLEYYEGFTYCATVEHTTLFVKRQGKTAWSGNSLPGAMNTAARAMGMTTQEFNKLVESGGLMADEFLPKFAQQLAAESITSMGDAANSSQANINRLNNALYEVQVTAGKELMPIRDAGLKAALAGVETLKAALPLLIQLLIVVGLKGASSMLGIGMAALKAQGGLFGLSAGLKVAMASARGMIAAYAPFLAVSLAITAAMDTFRLATQDAGKETKQFADDATEGLAKYLELTGRATEALQLLGKTADGVNLNNQNNSGILEETLIGKAARGVGGLFGRSGDQVNDGLRSYERAFADTYGMNTVGDVRADQSMQGVDALLNVTNRTQSEGLSLFNANTGAAMGDLARMQELDTQLRELQAKQAALSAGDSQGRQAIMTQRESLLRESEQVGASVRTLQESNAAQIEMLKAKKDRMAEMLKRTDISAGVRTQYEARFAAVNNSLESAVSLSDRFAKNITNVNTAATLLKRSLANIDADLERSNQQINLNAASTRESIAQSQLAGGTDGQTAFRTFAAGQETLGAQIEANREALAKLRSELNDSAITDAMSVAGLSSNSTPTQIRTRAEDFESAPETKAALEQAAERYERINSLSLETATLEADIAQAQVDAQQQLKQSSEAIADFYRDIERNAQEIQAQAKSSQIDSAAMTARSKLTRALSGFSNTFFDDFVDGLADLLDQMFEPLRIAQDAMQQKLNVNNQLADLTRQATELRNGLQPTAGGTFAGAAGGNPGYIRQVATGTLAAQEYGASRSGGARRHAGQDLDYGVNDRAQSFVGGVVTAIRSDPGGYGNYIDIYNETLGVVERLAEMDQVLVRVGQQISAGEDVGAGTRNTGVIHYEIRTDANAQGIGGGGHSGTVDPIEFLEQRGIIRRQGSQLIPTGGGQSVGISSGHHPGDGHDHGESRPVAPAARPQTAVSQTSAPSPDMARFIANFEGFSARAFWDHQQYSIGFGTRANSANEVISREEGERRLASEIERFSAAVDRAVTVDITPQQRTALTSLAYNIGTGAFEESTLVRKLNSGDTQGAADEFLRWNRASGQVNNGLTTRRQQEREMFLSSGTTPGQTQYPGMPGVNPGLQFGNAQINSGLTTAQQSATAQLAQIDQTAAAQTDAASANLQQSIDRARQGLDRSLEQLQDQVTEARQQQEQQSFALLGDSSIAQRLQEGLQQSQEFENANRDTIRNVERSERTIEALQESKVQIEAAIQEGLALGVDEGTLNMYRSLLPDLESTITANETELQNFQSQLDKAQTLYDAQNAMEDEQIQRDRSIERGAGLRQTAMLQLQRRAAMEGFDRNEIGSQVINQQLSVANIAQGYEDQIQPLERELTDLQEQIAALQETGLTLNDDQLQQVQEEVDYTNEKINRLTQQRDIEIEISQINFDSTFRQMQDDLQSQFTESAASYMESRNDTFGASALRESFANQQEGQRYDSQKAGIDALAESGRYATEELNAMYAGIEQLHTLNLENIDSQFKDLGETLADIGQNSLGTFFNDILTGSKSAGDAFKDLIGNILNQLAQLAVNALLKDIFGSGGGLGGLFGGGGQSAGGGLANMVSGLFGAGQSAVGGMGGMGGMGGGGGTVGTIVQLGSMLIGGMKDGGLVESANHEGYRSGYGAISEALKREGSQAVLAALTPGERVLTIEQSRRYEALNLDRVLNFKNGGVVGGDRPLPAMGGNSNNNSGNTTINIPINVESGNESSFDAASMQRAVRGTVLEEMMRQKRQNGISKS